jgi:hypothetical protein
MSTENHPNLHAVGLIVDIVGVLEKRLRGQAPKNIIYNRKVLRSIAHFVDHIEVVIDNEVIQSCKDSK